MMPGTMFSPPPALAGDFSWARGFQGSGCVEPHMLIMLALSQDAASDPKLVMIPDFKPPQLEERPVAGCAEYGWPGTQRPTVLRTRRGRFASCHQCESRRGLGRPGRLTTWSKERGKRQSELGVEKQSHEVSSGNADSPEASNTGAVSC